MQGTVFPAPSGGNCLRTASMPTDILKGKEVLAKATGVGAQRIPACQMYVVPRTGFPPVWVAFYGAARDPASEIGKTQAPYCPLHSPTAPYTPSHRPSIPQHPPASPNPSCLHTPPYTPLCICSESSNSPRSVHRLVHNPLPCACLLRGLQRSNPVPTALQLDWKVKIVEAVPPPPPSGRNAELLHLGTRRGQHKSAESWLISGLKDHRYISVTRGTWRRQWAHH